MYDGALKTPEAQVSDVSVAGALSPAKSPLSNSEALNQDVFCSNQESFYVVVSKQTGVHKGI